MDEESERGPGGGGCLVVSTAVEVAARDREVAGGLARDHRVRLAVIRTAIEAGQRDGDIARDKDPAALAHFVIATIAGLRVSARVTPPSAGLALAAPNPVLTVVLVLVLGVAGYVTHPVLRSRVFTLAPDAPTLVPAFSTSAFNVGITLTPMLGGAAIDAGLGHASVAWVGAGVGTLAVAATAWAAALARRASRAAADAAPVPALTAVSPPGVPTGRRR
ncbi:TetR family transcriptional regulator C-terminal domain-containing protein [Streptomyces sp. NPDC003016]